MACSVVMTVPSGSTIAGPVSSPTFRTTTITTGIHPFGDALCAGHPAGRVLCFAGHEAYSNVRPSHSNALHPVACSPIHASVRKLRARPLRVPFGTQQPPNADRAVLHQNVVQPDRWVALVVVGQEPEMNGG